MDLNSIRKTIEQTLVTELAKAPPIPVAFNNMSFDPTKRDSIVQCLVSFGSGAYLTQGGQRDSVNSIVGLIVLNIFTPDGVGSGANYTIGTRLRTLYNRLKTEGINFDSPIGPEVLSSPPSGRFQTQIRITFEVYEDLKLESV